MKLLFLSFSLVFIASSIPPAFSAQAMADKDHAAHMAAAMQGNDFSGEGRAITVDFKLMDHHGELVTDEQFRGKFLLLTFGFTHCEHICPMMGSTMGSVLRTIDQPAAGVFISIDPERDTPELTNNYAQAFNKSMVGLGGSYEIINKAVDNFLISYVVTKTQNSYTVQHTANIYLIDPDGKLVKVFPLDATVEEISAEIHSHQHSDG